MAQETITVEQEREVRQYLEENEDKILVETQSMMHLYYFVNDDGDLRVRVKHNLLGTVHEQGPIGDEEYIYESGNPATFDITEDVSVLPTPNVEG